MAKLVKWLIFSAFNGLQLHIKTMRKTAFDRYEEIVTEALNERSAKLRKNFKTAFIQTMILFMVIPRKINFIRISRLCDDAV